MAEASVMSHFGAGLREDIKRIVLGAANPPESNQRGGYNPSPPGCWHSQNAVESGPSPLTQGLEDIPDDPNPNPQQNPDKEEISGNF